MSGYDSRKHAKTRAPMRSSIACLRCRRSKIKCDNDGRGNPCDTCIKAGKECVFQMPDPAAPPPKKRDASVLIKQERDGGSEKKKLKKMDETSKVDSDLGTVYAREVLSAPFLTEDVWDQVLELHKLHFAPELPFLSHPAMTEKLGRRFKSSETEDPTEFNLVLLGILTLTARFHPDLVKYVAHIGPSQGGNARTRPLQTQLDPSQTSEYYANALTVALGPIRSMSRTGSVERVQALLMLGLYEWSQIKPTTGGLSAWMCVGAAIRMAQFLKLGHGDEPRHAAHEAKSMGPSEGADTSSLSRSQVILEKEIRRRTMFSCFVLDRMLACGRDRQSIIEPDSLQIQLPCAEEKFDYAMEVHTGFLRSRGEPASNHPDLSVLGQFIRLVDLWGQISRWSQSGGRLSERYAPWDGKSHFYSLCMEMKAFDEELPDTFKFSRSNYFKHESHKASSVYVTLHMLRNVCLIMLHREYIPFVPVRCSRPSGPVDHPIFGADAAPLGYWEQSAGEVFKAAREIVDLVEICQKKDKLPQSTIVLFAIWTASFVGLYAIHFPQMDTNRLMLSHPWMPPETGVHQKVPLYAEGATGIAYHTLIKMSLWLQMALTYVQLLRNMDSYFDKIIKDCTANTVRNKLRETAGLSLRLGGDGGGLEEYKKIPDLKNFGSLRPSETPVLLEDSDRSRASTAEPGSSAGAEATEKAQTPRSASSMTFKAINHPPSQAPPANRGFESRLEGQQQYGASDAWNAQQHHNAMGPPPSPDQAHLQNASPDQVAGQQNMLSPTYKLAEEEQKRFGDMNDLGILTSNDPPWLPGGDFPLFGKWDHDKVYQYTTSPDVATPYATFV